MGEESTATAAQRGRRPREHAGGEEALFCKCNMHVGGGRASVVRGLRDRFGGFPP